MYRNLAFILKKLVSLSSCQQQHQVTILHASFNDLLADKSDQILNLIKIVDTREELANQIKERQDNAEGTTDALSICKWIRILFVNTG